MKFIAAIALLTLASSVNAEKTVHATRYDKVTIKETCIRGQLFITTITYDGNDILPASTIQVLDDRRTVKCADKGKR